MLGVLIAGCAGASQPSVAPRGTTGAAGPTARRVGRSPLKDYEVWQVTRSDGPSLAVYVARQDEQSKKPLVLYLQGSHCLPLFMISEKDGRRREKSTVLFSETVPAELSRVHFAAIERRGLKSFGAPPASEAEARTAARCTPEHGSVSKRERVKDAADTVLALSKEPWVGGIFLLGHSEGAYVASGTVRHLGDGSVNAVGLLSGPGPTQFFDFLIEGRRRGDLVEVKTVFDELIWITGSSASGDYRGAAIERQVSYGVDSTSIDDLRDSHVPIFVANGTDDDQSPPESADVFVAEMLRSRSRLLRYVILPGMDHAYYSRSEDKDHAGRVLKSFVDWALAPQKDRSVLLGLPPGPK
jgi:pimeloyl-ACP methyl ester carboxylesterase